MPEENSNKHPGDTAPGKGGFESFRNEEDGLYYFQYLDDDGQAMLLSAGYPTSKERSNALRLVKRHLPNPARYKRLYHGRSFFFVLRSGNNKEIARSRPFDKKEERDAAMELLQNPQPKAKDAMSDHSAPTHPAPEMKKKKPSTPKAVQEKEPQRSRFKFNLTFRKAGEGDPYLAEIEYPLTKEKKSFKGLDLEALAAFVGKYLPGEVRVQPKKKKAKQKPAKKEKVEAKLKEVKPPAPPPPAPRRYSLEGKVHLLEKGESVRDDLIDRKNECKTQLKIQEKSTSTPPQQAAKFSATVQAKQVGSSNQTLVGEQHGSLPADHLIQVPLMIRMLNPGLYRIITTIKLQGPNDRIEKLESSRVVQIM